MQWKWLSHQKASKGELPRLLRCQQRRASTAPEMPAEPWPVREAGKDLMMDDRRIEDRKAGLARGGTLTFVRKWDSGETQMHSPSKVNGGFKPKFRLVVK